MSSTSMSTAPLPNRETSNKCPKIGKGIKTSTFLFVSQYLLPGILVPVKQARLLRDDIIMGDPFSLHTHCPHAN